MVATVGPFDGGAGAALGENDWMDTLAPMLQNDGVNSPPGSTALQVYGNSSGLQVLVKIGSALVRGVIYKTPTEPTVAITSNASGQTRYDQVVLRMDRTANTVTPIAIAGTPGAGVPPAITQTVGGTWDLPLGVVRVLSGASGINPSDVSDNRIFLPMKVGYCNSAVSSPPVDGSKGFLFYDYNPAVLDFITTNGSGWARLHGVWTNDGGWNAVGITDNFINWSFTLAYRIIGNECFWRGDIYKTASDGNPDVCVAPAETFPSWTSIHADSLTYPMVVVQGFLQTPEPGWYVRLSSELPTDVRMTIVAPAGGDMFGRRFRFYFSYLLN